MEVIGVIDGMRMIGGLELVIASLGAAVGVVSLHTASGVWRVRNGGMLTRALCGKLLAFAVWSAITLLSTIYLWHARILVSSIATTLSNTDRLVLICAQFSVVCWVIPKYTKPVTKPQSMPSNMPPTSHP